MSLESSIKRLEEVFPARQLDAQRVWGASGTTYVDAVPFTEGISGKTWRSLHADFLKRFHDAIDYVDPPLLGEYIPAYLRAVLLEPNDVSGLALFVLQALSRPADATRFDVQFGTLDESKKQAIAHALLDLECVHEGRPSGPQVSAVLDSYWRRYATEQGNEP